MADDGRSSRDRPGSRPAGRGEAGTSGARGDRRAPRDRAGRSTVAGDGKRRAAGKRAAGTSKAVSRRGEEPDREVRKLSAVKAPPAGEADEPALSQERLRETMQQSIALILISSAALLIIGVVMVYSATAPSVIRDAHLSGRVATFETGNLQLGYALAGVVLAVVASFIPLRVYQRFAGFIFFAGVVLQLLVLTPLGTSALGNTNWIRLFGPIRIQPSEFLKLATIVWLAVQLGRVRDNDWRLRAFVFPNWPVVPQAIRGQSFMPAGTGAIVGLVAILAGQDMGTAMVYGLICSGIFWLAGMPRRYFLAIVGTALFGSAVLIAMNFSRLNRVREYVSTLVGMPDSSDPKQIDFALWAFGSGGLSGGGLGTGIEKWPGNLAEAKNDFIFAVIGEELGMLGCLVVILMFVVLGWGLMRICLAHPSRVASLACGGAAIWICGQAIANMLVVTGVVPVFGVPLPFVSQGGSAVVACLLAVGFAVCCARSAPGMGRTSRVSGRLAYRARAVVKG
ncbi:MAG: FtsW/RodA/SpoVE family cell cycle protein [Actinomycetaceae bacterium]|nr:FtsW/RodA/SpoVE family cell cycle protein [Actinomycetaceae bacterium]